MSTYSVSDQIRVFVRVLGCALRIISGAGPKKSRIKIHNKYDVQQRPVAALQKPQTHLCQSRRFYKNVAGYFCLTLRLPLVF